jgi:hypothetical protein
MLWSTHMSRVGIVSFVVVIAIGACGTRHTFFYFFFDDSLGAVVVETGRPKDSRVVDASEMPLQYRLQRETYILWIFNEFQPVPPYLVVRVENLSSTAPLRLVHRPERADPQRRCASTVLRDDRTMGLSWICGEQGVHVIAFDILTEAGEVVAEETLPFALVENGWFVENDLL